MPYCVFSAERVEPGEWEGGFTAMLYNVAQMCRYPLGARHIVMETKGQPYVVYECSCIVTSRGNGSLILCS